MSEETAQTSLKMITAGWELEVSVGMEKVPLKVYQETQEERQTVCWIASEAGKVRCLAVRYQLRLLIRLFSGVFGDNQRKAIRGE
jgi:hypothetical protein